MAIRRVRIIIAIVAVWLLVTYFSPWPSFGTSPSLTLDGSLSHSGDREPEKIHWKPVPARYPVQTPASVPSGSPTAAIPKVQVSKPTENAEAKRVRLERLAAVKDSFKHSWDGYKKYAYLRDEVTPLTGSSKDPFGGWAATLVDSLDSLWIMGMKDDFEQAVKDCAKIDFTTTQTKDINLFETTIRYLGGFLAAYELSGKQHSGLLVKAKEVGALIMGAFDTPNRMPISRWDWRAYVKGKKQIAPTMTLVSEIGSLSLEFTKLSQLTGDMSFHDAAQRISDDFDLQQNSTMLPGMWPIVVDPSKTPIGFPGDTFTLGGMSDSLYEYFPKQYLLLGGVLEQPRKLYEDFIEVAKKHLFRRALNPENLSILFSGDVRIANAKTDPRIITMPRGQHLTCFAGGMVGLAARIFDRPKDLEIAQQLTDGCVWAYNATSTGIAPEIFHFIPCDPDTQKDPCEWSHARWLESVRTYWLSSTDDEVPSNDNIEKIIAMRRLPAGMLDVEDRKYILRPEAIESVFLMYRMTGDAAWMDKAWSMFTAIEGLTRTQVAAASLDDVTKESPAQKDSMESFWLAETLKYFYLVFSEWDVIDLDVWVLNTEAHPLRRADA